MVGNLSNLELGGDLRIASAGKYFRLAWSALTSSSEISSNNWSESAFSQLTLRGVILFWICKTFPIRTVQSASEFLNVTLRTSFSGRGFKILYLYHTF